MFQKSKDINVKVFNMITQNLIHVIVNANLIVQHVIQIKNGIKEHVNVIVKIYRTWKKDSIWNRSTCIC